MGLKDCMTELRQRVQRPSSPAQTARTRAKRRVRLLHLGGILLPYVQLLLALAGFLQYLILPLPIHQLARRAFIDENAFQPGQVNTYFSWPEVTAADRHAEALEEYRNSSSIDWSSYIKKSLQQAGLPTAVQAYRRDGTEHTGINTYARLNAPRTTGSEVVILCAPRYSRQDRMDNVRGVATLLVLAKHFQKLSIWSKDIIFLFPDGEIHGTQAWLTSYYRAGPQDTNSLEMATGAVWGAAVLDYPYHSFSHVGLYYDGVNGRLPNLDFVNAAAHISRWVGGVPIRFHNQSYSEPANDPTLADTLQRYRQRAAGILTQLDYSASTRPSGPEGLFGRYGIDSVGLFAVPAEGPHGFYTIGRIIESFVRAINNLLERLHASFFLYLLPEPFQFLSVAGYLSAPLLIGASLTFAGLRSWHYAPPSTGLVALTHCAASYVFAAMFYLTRDKGVLFRVIGAALPVLAYIVFNPKPNRNSPEKLDKKTRLPLEHSSKLAMHAFTALFTGMLTSVATILNYGLGVALSLLAGIPLLVATYTSKRCSSEGSRIEATLVPSITAALAAVTFRHLDPLADPLRESGAPLCYFLYFGLVPLWIQTCKMVLL